MLNKSVFVCLCGLILLDLVKTEPTEVTFNLRITKDKGASKLQCDEDFSKIEQNQYTVTEDEKLNLFINYKKNINYKKCIHLKRNVTIFECDVLTTKDNATKIKVTKEMEGKWHCMFLTLKNVNGFKPVVPYKDANYTAAFCFMQVHVLMKEPLRVLANNIQLKTVRDESTEARVFKTVYYYGDGDNLQIVCQTVNETSTDPMKRLTLEYDFGYRINNLFNTSSLSSESEIGFRSILNKDHDGKTLSCLYNDNFTSIIHIDFVYKKFANKIGVKINGLNIRLTKSTGSRSGVYEVTYENYMNKPIFLECEVYVKNLEIKIINSTTPESKIIKEADIGNKGQMKVNLSIMLNNRNKTETVICAADKTGPQDRSSLEQVRIHFKPKNEKYDLDVVLQNTKPFLELYEDKRKIVFYEYSGDMEVNLTCTATLKLGFVVNVKFENQTKKSTFESTEDFKQMELRHGSNYFATCFLYSTDYFHNTQIIDDEVLKGVTVFFTEAIQPESASTGLAIGAPTPLQGNPNSTDDSEGPDSMTRPGGTEFKSYVFVGLGSVTCIIIICISTIIFQMKKGRRSEGGPNNPTYVNIDGTSQASLPVYPTQWANNYAVPADIREENTTYCVPYRPEQIVYSIPIPKRDRKKKQDKETNHTYTNVQNTMKKQNNQDSNEPNYAQIAHRKIEPCYAKVLPKSLRKREEVSPYAYVTSVPNFDINDSNRSGQEPMYCEPQINK